MHAHLEHRDFGTSSLWEGYLVFRSAHGTKKMSNRSHGISVPVAVKDCSCKVVAVWMILVITAQ